MDTELKKKWVAALRSGQYQQGKGYLKKDGRYCCLGVLCSVLGVEPVEPVYDESRPCPGAGYDILEGPTGRLVDTPLFIWMNDGIGEYQGRPRSFAQIANYIEANL